MMHFRPMQRLRVYTGETSRIQGRPAFEYIVGAARRHGLAGATVLRGVMGYGANSLIHTAKILRLSEDLPVVIEVIDTPQLIERFLDGLDADIIEGVISLEDVRAAFMCAPRVRDAMTGPALTTVPHTPLAEVLDIMLTREISSLPVTENGKLVGIITGGDLLTRAGLPLRLSLQRGLPGAEQGRNLSLVRDSDLEAADIMSSPAISIGPNRDLREAARIMVGHKFKRLPVVDGEGNLLGIVSRADILKTLAGSVDMTVIPASSAAQPATDESAATALGVPTVSPDAPLTEVLTRLLGSPLRRVVVLDSDGRAIGVVMDRDLIRRFVRSGGSGALRALLDTLSSGRLKETPLEGTARDVMREPFSVEKDAPLTEVLAQMLETGAKSLLVLDKDKKPVGVLDRDAILRVLAEKQSN